MFTLQKLCPITSVDFYYNTEFESLRIYVGDEMGFVWVQDATELIALAGLQKIDNVTGNKKWNPFRKIEIDESYRAGDYEKMFREESQMTDLEKWKEEVFWKPLFDEKFLKQEC